MPTFRRLHLPLTVILASLTLAVPSAFADDAFSVEIHKVVPPPPVVEPVTPPVVTPPPPPATPPPAPKAVAKPAPVKHTVKKVASSSSQSSAAPAVIVQPPKPQGMMAAFANPENYRREKFLYHTPIIKPAAVWDPTQVSLQPSVTSSNLLIALVFAFLVWLANFSWDSIFHDYGHVIGKFLRRFSVKNVSTEGTRRTLLLIFFVLLYGIIGAYTSPDFHFFSSRNIGVLGIAVLTFVLATYANDLPRLVVARRWGCSARLNANIAGILLAVGCTVLNRLLNVAPGFLYGLPMSFMLLTQLPKGKHAGQLEVQGITWMIVAALVSWALLPLTGAFEVIHDFDNMLYVVLLESAFWLLLPLGDLPGAVILAWRKTAWLAAFLITVFLLFHTLFNPQSSIAGLLSNPPALHTIILMGTFTLGSLALWYALKLLVGVKKHHVS